MVNRGCLLLWMMDSLVSGRVETAQRAFREISEGATLHGLSDGTWSLTEAILALLDAVGRVESLTVSSWTFKGARIKGAFALASEDRIGELRFLSDVGFAKSQPEFCAALRRRFGPDVVQEWKGHAKFVVFADTELGYDLLYLTSANLHPEKRLESWSLTCGGPLPAQYARMVQGVMDDPPKPRRFSRDGQARLLE